jgi:two-component system response regulator NreC
VTAKIRVLVVDDHTLFRQGIVGLLNSQPDIEVVGEEGDAQGAVQAALRLLPDILLMDIAMPGISGLDAAREIKDRCPSVRILILTIHDREDYLYKALRAGASGYVLKGADIHDLLTAVRTAHHGEIYLYPSVAKKLVGEYLRQARSGEDPATGDRLSEREREILRFIAEEDDSGDRDHPVPEPAHGPVTPRPHHGQAGSPLQGRAHQVRDREGLDRALVRPAALLYPPRRPWPNGVVPGSTWPPELGMLAPPAREVMAWTGRSSSFATFRPLGRAPSGSSSNAPMDARSACWSPG